MLFDFCLSRAPTIHIVEVVRIEQSAMLHRFRVHSTCAKARFEIVVGMESMVLLYNFVKQQGI